MSRQSIKNQAKYNQLVSQIQQVKAKKNKQLAAILTNGQQVNIDHHVGSHSNRSFRSDSGMIDPALVSGFVMVDADTSEHADSDNSGVEGVSIYGNQTLTGGLVGQSHYRTDYSESNRLRDELAQAISGSPEDKRKFKQRKDQYRIDSVQYPSQLGYSDLESSSERQDGFSMMLALHRAKG